ncbi:type IV pilin N-terminal domain-containing protein [Halobaculum litoreum]|uniref:type IV pilin N-terminal domain-containing protein n=1 Tax=Halobaculum litoreum TaxID=3031998 RepID=UPI0024C23066|nr:type IV pilin N-terminal domain-containing protein [Halobaculum sp. DT92]
MNVHELFTEERAVSPVIGVILMVAITVILAAVVGSFVFGIGGQVQPSSPNANFQFDYSANTSTTYDVTARHSGGDTIPTSETVRLATPAGNEEFAGDVSAGKTATVFDVGADTTVRVIWVSGNGEDSAVLAEDSTPS